MPTHPTRRKNRTRSLRGIAVAPVAFASQPDARHRIDARENRAPLAAVLNFSRRTLAHEDAIDRTRESTAPVSVSFPGRDALGRRNPRMARRSFA